MADGADIAATEPVGAAVAEAEAAGVAVAAMDGAMLAEAVAAGDGLPTVAVAAAVALGAATGFTGAVAAGVGLVAAFKSSLAPFPRCARSLAGDEVLAADAAGDADFSAVDAGAVVLGVAIGFGAIVAAAAESMVESALAAGARVGGASDFTASGLARFRSGRPGFAPPVGAVGAPVDAPGTWAGRSRKAGAAFPPLAAAGFSAPGDASASGFSAASAAPASASEQLISSVVNLIICGWSLNGCALFNRHAGFPLDPHI